MQWYLYRTVTGISIHGGSPKYSRANFGGTSMSDKIPILLYHKNVLSLLCATTAPRCLGPYFNDTYEIMCVYIYMYINIHMISREKNMFICIYIYNLEARAGT
jgi:hypothetical protein